MDYKDAGVDIEAGERAVARIQDDVESTFVPEVLTGLGGFGALFAPDLTGYEEPVLVSGTDGVGTKLKVAFRMDYHRSVGVDLVAMCVNDILAQGAKPLFFLDYLATGSLDPEQTADVVKGIARGCKLAGCALIGGETAEMPEFYLPGEYDMAGFAVGIVDRKNIITGKEIEPGDRIIGLASDGVHSNGYSLVRKIFFDKMGFTVEDCPEGLETTLGKELIKPTRIYVKPVLDLLAGRKIKGIAHITGGGIRENLKRILPEDTSVRLDSSTWPCPEIFALLQKLGEVEWKEMYRTFNMGIGMALVVPPADVSAVVKELKQSGEQAYIIGEIAPGDKEVIIR
ncbi:MAG: phosphoribosylformylglycinamidine cyclo-ligase [Halanaerobiaceae bacterium]